MDLDDRFRSILSRFQELENLLAMSVDDVASYRKYSEEYAQISDVAQMIASYFALQEDRQELMKFLEEAQGEYKTLAKDELRDLNERYEALGLEIRLGLLPRDETDDSGVVLELRAGAGGDEAALFVATLLTMYVNYAQRRGWTVSLTDLRENDIGGYSYAAVEIEGRGIFGVLKHDSGVHRVQRIPVTESAGRIHTSTVTVAVLPMAVESVEINIHPKDLRIDTYRSQGAGGQHVNKTDSAVRITHLPTGFVVQCQDEKSQFKNKDRAMSVLKVRLANAERERLDQERSDQRRSQIGTADRSERIRTYNFPQGRVTDHRINLTLYKLDKILSGEEVQELFDALAMDERMKKMIEVGLATSGAVSC